MQSVTISSKYQIAIPRQFREKHNIKPGEKMILMSIGDRIEMIPERKIMYSRIKPMKKIAKMIRQHKPLIMNWFKAKKNISYGIVEGLNSKVKLTFKKAFGFRTFDATEIQLYHTLGDLPLPKFTHKFF